MKVSTRERISAYPYEFYTLYKSIGGNVEELTLLNIINTIESWGVFIDMVRDSRFTKANSIETMKNSKDKYKFNDISLVYQDKVIARITSDNTIMHNIVDLRLCNELKYKINELVTKLDDEKNGRL